MSKLITGVRHKYVQPMFSARTYILLDIIISNFLTNWSIKNLKKDPKSYIQSQIFGSFVFSNFSITLNIHMSKLDMCMSRLDTCMSRLDISLSVPTMLVLPNLLLKLVYFFWFLKLLTCNVCQINQILFSNFR